MRFQSKTKLLKFLTKPAFIDCPNGRAMVIFRHSSFSRVCRARILSNRANDRASWWGGSCGLLLSLLLSRVKNNTASGNCQGDAKLYATAASGVFESKSNLKL